MLNLVIINENDESCSSIKQILEKIMFRRKETYKISQYKKLNHNLNKLIIDQSSPKIYIINIPKENKSTLKLAQYIRNNDLDSELIILTNGENKKEIYEKIPKIYQIINKNKSLDTNLEKIVNTILNINYDNEKILNLGKTGVLQVYLKDIDYIYKKHNNRKLVIKTPNQTFYINNTLSGLLKKFDTRFVQVHKSCIVNKTKIRFHNWNEGYILLNNNQKLSYCSKKYCEKIINE